jgi:hypothetical protein
VNGSISELSLEAFYRVTGLLATSRPIIQLQKSSSQTEAMASRLAESEKLVKDGSP